MFPVVLNDGQSELPKDDIYYVIAKEGVFLKKKLGVMESLAPVKEISILESITATAKMHIEKIPGPYVAKIIEFFKEVHSRHRSEAIVLLFYEEETGKYTIIPPRQKVSFGSVDYNRGITIEGKTMIGTIHSHGSMSAFHSTIDDKDEETFDGLHITFGDVNDDEFSISASIIANGYRMMVDPAEYLDKIMLTKDIDEDAQGSTTTVYKWVDGKLQKDVQKTKRYGYSFRKYDKRYIVQVTDHQRIFNKKWLNVVEKGTYVYKRSVYGAGAYGYGWGYNYDPDAWKGHRQVGNQRHPNNIVVKKPNGTIPIQNVGPQKTPGIVFPAHDVDDEPDFNPCAHCNWRDIKLEWALEQFTEEAEDEPDEEDLIDNFIPGETYVEMFGANDEGMVTCHVCREEYDDSLGMCPACHNRKPDISRVPMLTHPLAGEDFICTTCGNTFTHRGVDMCPFCEQELDFSEFLTEEQQKVAASDEEIEVHSAGNLTKGQWYLCNLCTTLFEANAEECNCPKCEDYMVDGYNCTPYSTEAERQARLKKDSGELCKDSGNTILEAAAEYDKTLERIPVPEKDSTPLSTHVQKTSKMSIKEMFKKTFGGKK